MNAPDRLDLRRCKPRDFQEGRLHRKPDDADRLRSIVIPFVIFTAIWGSTWIVIRGQLGDGAAAMVGNLSLRHRRRGDGAVARVEAAIACNVGRQGLLAAVFLGFTQFCINFNAVYLAERHITSGGRRDGLRAAAHSREPAGLGTARPPAHAGASPGARWWLSAASSCCSSTSFASIRPTAARSPRASA